MVASQLKRILQQNNTNKIVDSMRVYVSEHCNAKLSARARLPNGQSAVTYIPNEKHFQTTADIEIGSDFWTQPREMCKGVGGANVGAELNAFPSPKQKGPFTFQSLHTAERGI